MTAKPNFYCEGKYQMDILVTSTTKRSADDEIYTSWYFNVLVLVKVSKIFDLSRFCFGF